MIINVTFDPSVVSAPAGFTAAISYVVDYLEATFANPVTLNLDVGWGEIDGQTVSASYLGESLESVAPAYTYSQVKNALAADATSSAGMAAVASLPNADPTNGGNFDLGTAEAKALGLYPNNSSTVDGWVGFYGGSGTFTFDPTERAVPGEYDFIGIALHEITEVMGRDSDLGYGPYPDSFTALDLFRYSAPDVRDLTSSARRAYFSIDNGATNLDNFNTDPSGDFGDWANSAGNDSFLAFSNSGVVNAFSATDVDVMDALGWNATSAYTNDVTDLYQNILFRSPDLVGLYSWASELGTGESTLPQLVNAFVDSSEAVNVVYPIVRLYDGLFGREPDLGGIQTWVGAEDSGLSLASIVQYFVTSAEFVADYGSVTGNNETQFITALYEHFLQRSPDAQGLATWLSVLGPTPSPASEAAVVLAFVNCQEFINDLGSGVATWLADTADAALQGSDSAAQVGGASLAQGMTSESTSATSLGGARVSANLNSADVNDASSGTGQIYDIGVPFSGNIEIRNFDVNTDQLEIASDLSGNIPISIPSLLATATVSHGTTTLHLTPHEAISLIGITSVTSIAHDLVIV